jgi:hypothetical protein
MTTYRISWSTWANTVTEVEADTVEEAISAAYDEELPRTLCHHCAHDLDLGDEWDPTSAYADDEEVPLPGAEDSTNG